MAAGAEDHRNMLPNDVDHKKKLQDQRKPLCACTAYSLNKLFVFLYAFLFLIVGSVLLIVGIWAEAERRNFNTLDSHLSAPVTLLIILGLFIAINAILGIVGALKENLTLLRLFLAFTVIAFCVQIIIGVLAFVYREKVADRGHEHFKFAIVQYTTNDHIHKALDHLQSRYSCCGLDSFNDYNYNAEYACNSNHTHSCSVPPSCCRPPKQGGVIKEACGLGIRDNRPAVEVAKNIFRKGCLKNLREWLIDHFDVLGAMTLGWAIPQIFGMLLVYFFIRRVYDMHVWYRVNAY